MIYDILTGLAFYYTFKFVLVLWMALPQTSYVHRTPRAQMKP
jgi:hypothetical protein